MDADFFCAGCQCVLRTGENNLQFVKIIAIADPTPEELAAGITLDEIQNEMAAIYRQLEGTSAHDAMRENYSRLQLHFCKTCFRRWIENPVNLELEL